MSGCMDHLPIAQVDACMSHVTSPAKEKQITRKQLGEIHVASHDRPHLGLFSARAGKVDVKSVVDKLDKPGTICGRAVLKGSSSGVRSIQQGFGPSHNQLVEIPRFRRIEWGMVHGVTIILVPVLGKTGMTLLQTLH